LLLPLSQVLAISRGGLERRGLEEAKFLNELEAIAESGITEVSGAAAVLLLLLCWFFANPCST
jgi:gamma-glutamylcysteine synthetase